METRSDVAPSMAGWNRAAARYEEFFVPITRPLIEPLLDAARVAPGSRVLDVGTGPGEVAASAARRGAPVVGVDSAEEMLRIATRLHPALTFVRATAERLPFDAARFDAVVGNLVIQHVAQPEPVLAECKRVLAPGGCLALTVWDTWAEGHGLMAVQEAMRGIEVRQPPDQPPPSYFAAGAGATLARLLTQAGLTRVSVEHVRFTRRFARSADLWDGMLAISPRTGPLVAAQTEETQRQIRAAFERLVEPYTGHSGLDLPASAALVSGRNAAI